MATTLRNKVELYASGGTKLAVNNLAHITTKVLDNIKETRTDEELTNAIFDQCETTVISNFDAEIGKHKQVKRYYDRSTNAQLPTTSTYTSTTVGQYVAESLFVPQALGYGVCKVRRLLLYSDSAQSGATIRVTNQSTGATTDVTGNIVAGWNKLDVDVSVDCSYFPLSIKVGFISNGNVRLKPFQSDILLSGLVQRRATDTLLVQAQWEVIVDPIKVVDDFSDELKEAFWYKCGVLVLNWHLKSQAANRETLVGREQIIANRDELEEQYKQLLKNAVTKILPALEVTAATKHDTRFDVGYEVGSIL